MRSDRLIKTVAILLLAWAVMDLLVPGLCAVEAEPADAVVHTIRGGAQHSDVRDPASDDDRGPDDCFCCCSHVLPKLRATVDVSRSPVNDVRVPLPRMPRGILSLVLHPPRA